MRNFDIINQIRLNQLETVVAHMVVLEGPDGGGKTTLAEVLSKSLKLEHIRSEGPEKYPGEIDERIQRYHRGYGGDKRALFDRHPCVSQLAYGLVHNQSQPRNELVQQFYDMEPLLIYCRPGPVKVQHTASGEWDTPEYLAKVDSKMKELTKWYDNWALWNANYIYRIGDSVRPIEDLIKGWRRI